MSGAAIQDEILKLSAPDRARLIEVLWDSLSTREIKERETAWAKESERRIDAVESGQLKVRDAKTVFSELRKKLKK
jgi:putative addiction module component (TIGR02574 family)